MADNETIKNEYDELLQKLSDPELISNWEKFEELSKKKKHLEQIIEKQKETEEIKKQIEENKAILSSGEDKELTDLAEVEIVQLQEKAKILHRELEKLLKNESTLKRAKAILIEIRAGTGGEEAALFATDLYKMYSKYATSCGWKQKVLDSRPTDLGGFKQVIFELKPASPAKRSEDDDILPKMKYEAGVHRVQRIPRTEKSGRIHTSTATVAVLIKPKPTEIKIKPEEIKIDFYCASGPGGQYVNKRETAVRITHLPTGLVVTSQTERNQLQNRENALSILSARLLEKKEEMEQSKIAGKRKTQIGWAKRAEKIRTYNFPQDRVTDHRIKKTWHNIEKIIAGEIEPIVKSLQKNLQ